MVPSDSNASVKQIHDQVVTVVSSCKEREVKYCYQLHDIQIMVRTGDKV